MKEKTKLILEWIAARIKEPTTWHGINILLTAIGVTLEPALMQAIITIGMGVSSLILIITKERE